MLAKSQRLNFGEPRLSRYHRQAGRSFVDRVIGDWLAEGPEIDDRKNLRPIQKLQLAVLESAVKRLQKKNLKPLELREIEYWTHWEMGAKGNPVFALPRIAESLELSYSEVKKKLIRMIEARKKELEPPPELNKGRHP